MEASAYVAHRDPGPNPPRCSVTPPGPALPGPNPLFFRTLFFSDPNPVLFVSVLFSSGPYVWQDLASVLADVEVGLVELDPVTAMTEHGLGCALQDMVPCCYFLRFLLSTWQAVPLVRLRRPAAPTCLPPFAQSPELLKTPTLNRSKPHPDPLKPPSPLCSLVHLFTCSTQLVYLDIVRFHRVTAAAGMATGLHLGEQVCERTPPP